MAHSLNAAAPQVYVVGSFRNHWAFNLDDPDNAFRDYILVDAARVSSGRPGILHIIAEWKFDAPQVGRRSDQRRTAKEIPVASRRMQPSFYGWRVVFS